MTETPSSPALSMRDTLRHLAPGTALRDGLERIVRGKTGALIVLGFDQNVEDICDGGFELDVPFAATRLRELCKMDGAVVLSTDRTRIRRANVQLIPDPTYPTEESGTRHRSAERTALHTGFPVISVSQSMNMITVYVGGTRHILEGSSAILSRANQVLATVERYRTHLDHVNNHLHVAEMNGYASLSDVVAVVQRMEMLRRAAAVIDDNVVELGTDGKQLGVQLAELYGSNEADRDLIIRDYLVTAGLPSDEEVTDALDALHKLSDKDLVKANTIAQILGFPSDLAVEESLTSGITPRGYRALARIPRVQQFLADQLVSHFHNLNKLLDASVTDIEAVDNVGALWAQHLYDGLHRLPR